MIPRSPVVTILGHVDHGKTTLLDYIRKSRVASKEHGGITQKIGAYEAKTGIKDYPIDSITFIDTPGHEAFSLLRARGANVADIAILIVDGKDSLMPQTIESISHIKTANIPFIVAINKTDLPEANPNKVKQDLMKYEIITEDKGGNVPAVLISAKTGKGIPELLETILFIATDKKLSYDPAAQPQAYIIETKKDKRGVVVSCIIKEGILKVTNTVFSEGKEAKIRSFINDAGEQLTEVTPSTPFELLGFSELPPVGSLITTVEGEAKVEEVGTNQAAPINLQEFLQVKKEEKKLNLIVKTDAQGSLEAIVNALAKNVNIKLMLSAVGDIYKSDVFLAKTSGAIIIGFNAKIDPDVKQLAKQEKVIIKTYTLIYELLEELTEVADLIKEKEEQAKSLKGEAKILANFVIHGEKILGFKVTKGKINLGDSLHVFRNDNPIGKTRVVSLQNRARKIEEAKKDTEAGMVIGPPLDIRVGDVVKSIL